MSDTLSIRKPDDFHVHLRQGAMLRYVLPYTARDFARALVMPNIRTSDEPFTKNLPAPPIFSAGQAFQYYGEIIHHLRTTEECYEFEPLMTIALLDETTISNIEGAYAIGVRVVKAYPKGVTTNSEYGVSDFHRPQLLQVLERMEEYGMVLSLHGEKPGVFSSNSERAFLETLEWLHFTFPKLKIVLEHISTRHALRCVESLGENVGATVTLHHLMLTLDDVVGGKLNPHNFCKPIPKTPDDLEVLQQAVATGCPRLFFGSDSAPHEVGTKECAEGCAGIFSAPYAMPLLAQLFESWDALPQLEPFTSEFGATFYGLPQNTGTLILTKVEQPYIIPRCEFIENNLTVVNFMAGSLLSWRVKRADTH